MRRPAAAEDEDTRVRWETADNGSFSTKDMRRSPQCSPASSPGQVRRSRELLPLPHALRKSSGSGGFEVLMELHEEDLHA